MNAARDWPKRKKQSHPKFVRPGAASAAQDAPRDWPKRKKQNSTIRAPGAAQVVRDECTA
jgi:hypothetical protein